MNEAITIYWAPSRFTSAGEQWNMLYGEPKAVADNLVTDIPDQSLMVRCPATRNLLKNVYSVHANLDEEIDLTALDFMSLEADRTMGSWTLPVESKIAIHRERPTSFHGYVNITYNMGWMFFASEPVTARWTAPYFPNVTPTPGSIFAIGEFDIGQWFRSTNLDYHIPTGATRFTIRNGDPLAFLEVQTSKQVKFQRFTYTQELSALSQEFSGSPAQYGKRKTLQQRYDMARRSGMSDLVLKHICANLV